MSDGVFHYLFEGRKCIERDFDLDREELDGCEIVFAAYEFSDDNGEAYVLYFNDEGQLREVYATHDAWDGLEGMWDPEPATKAEILRRIDSDDIRVEGWHTQLRTALARL